MRRTNHRCVGHAPAGLLDIVDRDVLEEPGDRVEPQAPARVHVGEADAAAARRTCGPAPAWGSRDRACVRSLPCNNPSVDGHEGHSHAVKPDADARRLWIALGLIAGFMAAEVVVGILADSLALLSDAAHMLTDAGALVLSLVVIRLMQAAGGRQPHLRPQAHGDPVRPGERRHPARARAA